MRKLTTDVNSFVPAAVLTPVLKLKPIANCAVPSAVLNTPHGPETNNYKACWHDSVAVQIRPMWSKLTNIDYGVVFLLM